MYQCIYIYIIDPWMRVPGYIAISAEARAWPGHIIGHHECGCAQNLISQLV